MEYRIQQKFSHLQVVPVSRNRREWGERAPPVWKLGRGRRVPRFPARQWQSLLLFRARIKPQRLLPAFGYSSKNWPNTGRSKNIETLMMVSSNSGGRKEGAADGVRPTREPRRRCWQSQGRLLLTWIEEMKGWCWRRSRRTGATLRITSKRNRERDGDSGWQWKKGDEDEDRSREGKRWWLWFRGKGDWGEESFGEKGRKLKRLAIYRGERGVEVCWMPTPNSLL